MLIGSLKSPDVTRLSGFLERNGIPFRVIDPDEDADASSLLARFAPQRGELPIVVIPDGAVLKNPTKHDLAQVLGLVATTFRSEPYDVAIVGAGSSRAGDRRLRSVRGPLDPRPGSACVWRTGRRQRAHRELSGLSNRRLGAGADGACLHAGAEVRRRCSACPPR